MSTEPIDKYLFTSIQRQFSDTHIEKQSHQHMPQNKPHRKRDNCKRSDNQTEERTIMIRIKILCIRSVKRRLIPRMPKNIFEPTLKSKACLKCLYFTIIIFDLCRYLEYFSYLYTINQTE